MQPRINPFTKTFIDYPPLDLNGLNSLDLSGPFHPDHGVIPDTTLSRSLRDIDATDWGKSHLHFRAKMLHEHAVGQEVR